MKEIWKDLVGYEGYYQVSNTGLIKSLKRIVPRKTGSYHPVREKILTINITKFGYASVNLNRHGKILSKKVHRLVLSNFTFHSTLEVNHLDGNKLNNNLKNLEYVTTLENANHRETILRNKKKFGSSFSNVKGKWQSNITIRGKQKHLGYFETKEEGHQAFYNAYLKAHGVTPW